MIRSSISYLLFFLISLMIIAICAPAFADNSIANSAVTCFKNGQYAKAQIDFEKLVAAEPGNTRALYYLALTCLKLSQIDRAKGCFEKIVKSWPDSTEARFSQSELAQMSKQNSVAVAPIASQDVSAKAGSASQTQSSRDSSPNIAVPHVDEISYWQRVRNCVPQSGLVGALLLKPKYRDSILNGKSTADSITSTTYDPLDRALDMRWIAAQQSAEESFTPQASPHIILSGYNINQWVGYKNGDQRLGYDADGLCYKLFFEFKDAARDLTPARYLAFVHRRGEVGFNGDSKVSTRPGYVRFNYNNIVVHACSMEDAFLAEKTGLEFFGPQLEHYGRGLDVAQSDSNGVWSQIQDWHHFLGTASDLSRLPAKALRYAQYQN